MRLLIGQRRISKRIAPTKCQFNEFRQISGCCKNVLRKECSKNLHVEYSCALSFWLPYLMPEPSDDELEAQTDTVG